jgi:hypothetical protein
MLIDFAWGTLSDCAVLMYVQVDGVRCEEQNVSYGHEANGKGSTDHVRLISTPHAYRCIWFVEASMRW